jgi:Ca-activated chloride channel family protein
MPEQFHFIHPAWLLGLLPLLLVAWLAFRPAAGGNAWRRVVDARLLPWMMASPAKASSRGPLWLLSLGWLVAIAALADPTWQRKPQPVFQTGAARVVVLDLSTSMNDADLAPSRLARARYKVEDVLAQSAEGQTGLVVYAGDAFTVSPLTRDANTIRSLLKVLEPDLMPVQGSRADLGLRKAGELLRQAGVTSGQVLLIADGVEAGRGADAQRAATQLRGEGYRVSVLGVGTANAAPLTDETGRLARGAGGQVELPRLDAATLRSLAQAGGGQYQAITDDGTALRALLDAGKAAPVDGRAPARSSATAWRELGPVLAVLLLPLGALAFRRNWLVSAALLATLAATSQGASASTWSDLWQRPDQQAAKELAAGDFAAAAKVAPDAGRRGSAQYKLGHYADALQDFAATHGADADYNRGNALARLGRYPEAVAAYDQAIAETSANADAKANKAAVEALMKQRPPEQSPSPQSGQKPQSGQRPGEQGQQAGQKQGQQQGQQQRQEPGQQAQQQAGSKDGSKSPSQGQASGSRQNSAKTGGAQAPGSGPQPDDHAHGSRTQGAPDGRQASANGGAAQQTSPGAPQRDRQAAQDAASPPANAFSQALQKLARWAGARKDDAASTAASPTAGVADNNTGRPAGVHVPQRTAAQDADAQPLDSEEKLAAQQWLARIPDDPGGLLRRKFLYQYRQRAHQQGGSTDD